MSTAKADSTCGSCDAALVSREAGGCLLHATDEEIEDAVASGRVDARGAAIAQSTLDVLLDAKRGALNADALAVEVDFEGASFKGTIDFRSTLWSERTSFVNAIFEGHSDFSGCRFEQDVSFAEARLEQGATFAKTEFGGACSFEQAHMTSVEFTDTRFEGDADFRYARLTRVAFDRVRFHALTRFSSATLVGATLRGVSFESYASFDAATFAEDTSFGPTFTISDGEGRLLPTRFDGHCSMGDTLWEGPTSFNCLFRATTSFDRARFESAVELEDCEFADDVSLRGATFNDRLWMSGADVAPTFLSAPVPTGVRFRHDLDMSDTEFNSDVVVAGVVVEGDMSLADADFALADRLGPIGVTGCLDLDGANFRETVRIEVACDRLTAVGARFRRGANLQLRWADAVFDQAEFERPSTVAGTDELEGVTDDLIDRLGSRAAPGSVQELLDAVQIERDERPRIVSLQGAFVGNLVLVGCNLRVCRFRGAHNLDQLRLDETSDFARTPRGTTDRQALAEEHVWRARRQTERQPRRLRGSAWNPRDTRLPEWATSPAVTSAYAREASAAEIAAVYRELRKGREDAKDEPGANDLYYGEMEMRRLAERGERTRWAQSMERLPLTLYWAISGYGLRAARALAALLVLVVVGAFALHCWGFPTETSLASASIFSAESAVSLIRGASRELTTSGSAIALVLRLGGAACFALAVLAVRARVKR